ncbi:hypothetical protein Tco_1216399 [Tanacetum coccineum]
MKSRKRRYIQNTSEDDSDKENDELRLHLTIAPDEEKEVDYEILDRKYPIKEWKTECLGTKPQTDQAEHFEEINQNVVIRSNGQKRYFSSLMRVLSIFDREDLNAVYQLVMDRFQDEMPEGFHRVLWGDLMVMFNPDDENEFWNSQLDWIIVSWKLHSSSGVHTLVTETGLVIHMLVEKKYPLRKEVLMQMLKLKLESEEDSTMALELIKFVKKILAEHKNWLVHKQTACGKDFSNPFMVDNLPKIVGFSTHLASVVKSWLVHDQTVHALASPKANELTIPDQTATGKGTSNPLMAGQCGLQADASSLQWSNDNTINAKMQTSTTRCKVSKASLSPFQSIQASGQEKMPQLSQHLLQHKLLGFDEQVCNAVCQGRCKIENNIICYMDGSAKLGDVDNLWKIEKLRSGLMKTHIIGSALSCAYVSIIRSLSEILGDTPPQGIAVMVFSIDEKKSMVSMVMVLISSSHHAIVVYIVNSILRQTFSKQYYLTLTELFAIQIPSAIIALCEILLERLSDNGSLAVSRQIEERIESDELNMKLSELKVSSSTDKEKIDELDARIQDRLGEGVSPSNGISNVNGQNSVWVCRSGGAKRRKSGAVKRFKQDSHPVVTNHTPDAIDRIPSSNVVVLDPGIQTFDQALIKFRKPPWSPSKVISSGMLEDVAVSVSSALHSAMGVISKN